MRPTISPIFVDISGSGEMSGDTSGDVSGRPSGEESGSGVDGSGTSVSFKGSGDRLSGDGSASGVPEEAVEGSTVTFSTDMTSGDISGDHSGKAEESGSAVPDFHSGYLSGEESGSSMVILVDGQLVDQSITPTKVEHELGRGPTDLSCSGFPSGDEFQSGSGFLSGSGFQSGSGFLSGDVSGSASGLPDLTFVDHSLIDQTGRSQEEQEEQELSGVQPSGFGSAYPSGFSSGASGHADRGGVILNEDEVFEVMEGSRGTEEQGQGSVEASGYETGKLSIELPPGYTNEQYKKEFMSGRGPYGHASGHDVEVMPTTIWIEPEVFPTTWADVTTEPPVTTSSTSASTTTVSSITTASSLPLQTPALVEEPAVEDGKDEKLLDIPSPQTLLLLGPRHTCRTIV